MSHIATMLQLHEADRLLDDAQTVINAARISFSEDQHFQLELDRKQATLNDKRRRITMAIEYIATQN